MSFKKNSLEDFILDTKLNSSDRKRIRAYVQAHYPGIVPYMNDIWPKNEDSVHYVSVRNSDAKAQVIAIKGQPAFFTSKDERVSKEVQQEFKIDRRWIPTLKLIHQYPCILTHQQVDKGAIPFVLSGADVMCPGLTSAGGSLADTKIDDVVAITAEGKQHAMAVGKMILDSEQIRTQNKGHGIRNLNVMCDGLWYLQDVHS
ncbi:malignant T-cell-amplified sequence 2-like [Convolutriloba macropyga]|uniref:malignant T-cell-amplified sequence 2-like n=1 Tax=Convolutriloba macropyga TaxID=536237 RepID=UPI003F5252B1